VAELISHRDKAAALVQFYRREDPRLAEILDTILGDLHHVIVTVNPIESVISGQLASAVAPGDVTNVFISLLPLNIQLAWPSASNAQFYEIREGLVWETASFVVKTASLSVALNPRLIGTYDYLIKAINPSNVYSNNAFAFQVIIPPLGVIILSVSVIDNNVLLSWTVPTSVFQIQHYNVYRNTFQFAELTGNFLARFEAASGLYTFEVEAEDVAGNLSAKASASANVSQPPDYVLQDTRVVDPSTMTLVNSAVVNGKLIACLDLVETFEAHFNSRSWLDPEDQVTAGYERWIQDNLLSGSALDQFDYGTVLNNTVATVSFLKEVFSGTNDVTVTIKMSFSLDGVTWSSESIGEAQFIPSVRYLRVKLEFSTLSDDAMIEISNIVINLSVKREVDSGSVMAEPTDIDGTLVFFNKTFKDIDSLTATVESITPIFAIVEFVDVPNPTFFRVMAFDSAGQRVRFIVDWKARGIV